ncbi:hypothetical protein GALMADRAFT_270282 [Galerina marginata CBS 339.88]|uniref:Uncharacterized protein n=1 Tax=Galerina marginata (strain CBS 339.88) TaxID=685588 RepID=A0A067SS47_GALM3|nr:hypothetical protein GALMADRAFT_270282 [Galerina marginata CBS 339.88]
MPFGVKYVPISPGMYNQAPQTTFPDLNTFVPLSEEVLMKARQNIEEFLSHALLEDNQQIYASEPFPDAVPNLDSDSDSVESPVYEDSEEYFKFLMEHEGDLSTLSPPDDFTIESPGSACFPEDMPWEFPTGMLQEPEIWDPTTDLETLISSTEYMDQATLDSMHQSLEELEHTFYSKASPTSAPAEA